MENSSDSKNDEVEEISFASFGLEEALVEAIDSIGWKSPTEIQGQAIPEALLGKDIIGLAETGSGKVS